MIKDKTLTEALTFLEQPEIAKQLREDLSSLIAIPSVAVAREGSYPYGKQCAAAINTALDMGRNYGFTTENHEYYCASILHGSKPEEVGLVAHLDVVPAGNGWSGDPFELTVRDDMYIGRGALDDKGPFICCLYALRFLKETNKSLPFSVRLIAGSDEEVGSSDLEYFARVKKPPFFSFTPDAEFPVCIGEKGILQVDIMLGRLPNEVEELSGGSVSNAVPDTAYAVIWDSITDIKDLKEHERVKAERPDDKRIKITASGKGAHAALPENGVNAIGLLARFLLDNELIRSNKKPFTFLARSCGEYLGNALGIDRTDEKFGYSTCVGGTLSVEDGIIVQNFNIRYIPDTTYEAVLEKIKNTLAPQGFAVRHGLVSEGYSLSEDDERIRALTDACEAVLGHKCKPYTMGGGTYARWLANTVAFGPAIENERGRLGSDKGGAHQADEYISAKELENTILIYIKSIMNLAEVYKEKLLK